MKKLNEIYAYSEKSKSCLIRINGKEAGSLDSSKYYRVSRLGKKLICHRVIYELFNGPIPDGFQIDHINGIKTDNRIENLRLATSSQNQQNQGWNSRNTAGVRGLDWNKGSWRGKIRCGGVRHYFHSQNRMDVEEWLIKTRESLHKEFSFNAATQKGEPS